MLPNFIIVGAPKAGTTSLYYYLLGHPQVFLSQPKEVNYFSSDEILKQGLYYNAFMVKKFSDYIKLFEGAKDKVAIGEASVSYLYYPDTPAKIKSIIPNVKIIILLRSPVERAYSHYLMDYRMGLIDFSFEDIVYDLKAQKYNHLFYQQYIELGFYYEQVKRYLDLFGGESVKIILLDDMRLSTREVILDLYDYLNVDNSFVPVTDCKYNVLSTPKSEMIRKIYSSDLVRLTLSKILTNNMKERLKNLLFERKIRPKINEDTKEYLSQLYLQDVKRLEQLIDRDLSCWTN